MRSFIILKDEFYNGEFSGSQLTVTIQNLNPGCDPFKNINPKGIEMSGVRIYSSSGAIEYEFGKFIDPDNEPTDGYISIWYQNPDSTVLPEIDPNSQADPGGGSSS